MPPPAVEFCISGLLSPSFVTPSLAAYRLDKHDDDNDGDLYFLVLSHI